VQNIEAQTFAQTSQNPADCCCSSIGQALQGQISAISDQSSNRRFAVRSIGSTEIAKLKQQSQGQFHLIELACAQAGQSASVPTSVENALNLAPPPGTIVSVLVGSTQGLSSGVGNLTTGSIGSTISTKA
jgi:hypothetical protein